MRKGESLASILLRNFLKVKKKVHHTFSCLNKDLSRTGSCSSNRLKNFLERSFPIKSTSLLYSISLVLALQSTWHRNN